MLNSSPTSAGSVPIIAPWLTAVPIVSASRTSGGARVSGSQKNGNAHATRLSAQIRYTGLRPIRSDSRPHASIAPISTIIVIITPVSITLLGMPTYLPLTSENARKI